MRPRVTSSFAALLLTLAGAGCRIGFHEPADATILVDDASEPVIPVIVDDFEDGVRDAQWIAAYEDPDPAGTKIAELAGELQVAMSTNLSGSYAGLGTGTLDLLGKALWLELAGPVPQLPGVCFVSWGNGTVSIGMRATGTKLEVLVDDIIAATVIDAFPAMRWWRMREHAGEVVFEVGSDGRVWTELHRVASAAYASGGFGIAGGTFGVHPGGETCRYAAVGVPPP